MSAATSAAAKLLIIMRGLPGSGKSFLAKGVYDSHVNDGKSCIIHSTDNFHLELDPTNNKRMVYVFKPEKLGYFHKQNLLHTIASMEIGVDCVIVDNTNTTWKEVKPYVEAAKNAGYRIDILDPITTWAFDVNECAKKNTHGVPKEAIQRMKDRWETTNSLLTKGNLLLQEEANKSKPIEDR